MNMKIGSGDIAHLMMGKQTKGFQDLLRKFVSDEIPYYNAIASPIDALRTGAILEEIYLKTLSNDYYIQYKVTFDEMNVFTASLDFAKIENGNVVDFDELKTLFLPDFIEIIEPIRGAKYDTYIKVIKKSFPKYYNQIQEQLMCSELYEANLVFLSVDTYEDELNWNREISGNDVCKFRIKRDEKVISDIMERGKLFQNIKDYFN